MEHNFLGCPSGKFPGQTELLKSSPSFPVGMFKMDFLCFIYMPLQALLVS